jgi:hypothetical protein
MGNNLPEEVGHVTRTAIDTLRQYPSLLALIMMNIVIFAVFGYLSNVRQMNDHAEINKILDACYDRPSGPAGPH